MCANCAVGTYNPDAIAEECKPCNLFHITTGENSDAVSDCKRKFRVLLQKLVQNIFSETANELIYYLLQEFARIYMGVYEI